MTNVELHLENLETLNVPMEDIVWFEYKEGSKSLYKNEAGEFDGYTINNDVLIAFNTSNVTSSYEDVQQGREYLDYIGASLVGVTLGDVDLDLTFVEEDTFSNSLHKQKAFDKGKVLLVTNNYRVFKPMFKELAKDLERMGGYKYE